VKDASAVENVEKWTKKETMEFEVQMMAGVTSPWVWDRSDWTTAGRRGRLSGQTTS